MLLIQCTVATDELLCLKNAAPMAIENIKILRAVFELPAKQHCQFSPFGPFWGKWAGLALLQNDPQDFDFSIAIGADYLSYVKSIATFAPTFYGYIISVLASVI